IIDSIGGLISKLGASPFDLTLPAVANADTRAYKTANLFRRYGIGEGQISEDGKLLRLQGDLFLLHGDRNGTFEGTFEFVKPIFSPREPQEPASLPYNLQTLSIKQVPLQSYCQEKWTFADGSSLVGVGFAMIESCEILTGQGVLWISAMQRFATG